MLHNPDVMKRCQRQIDDVIVLNIGPIRMYILMLGTRNVECRTNEGCTYVH